LAALTALRQASSIFEFQAAGEPPERYTLTFRGRGACRAGSARGGVEICTLHRCEMRLPFTYPDTPPDVRWLTPIVHPNISYSGFLSWREIGIEWNPELTLDIVCERLWDVARLAYVNQSEVLNYSAQQWLDEQNQWPLPLDDRPLRDVSPKNNPNIVRYRRRDGQSVVLADIVEPQDVLYIGEDAPGPASPARGDDILYIGDE